VPQPGQSPDFRFPPLPPLFRLHGGKDYLPRSAILFQASISGEGRFFLKVAGGKWTPTLSPFHQVPGEGLKRLSRPPTSGRAFGGFNLKCCFFDLRDSAGSFFPRQLPMDTGKFPLRAGPRTPETSNQLEPERRIPFWQQPFDKKIFFPIGRGTTYSAPPNQKSFRGRDGHFFLPPKGKCRL